METKTTIIGSLTLALILSWTYVGVTGQQPNYACAEREVTAYCYDLSSTAKTCYTLPAKTGGKLCSEGWKLIDYREEKSKLQICTYEGCK
jgi:hypothetical protein